jgi:flagellar motility protein MotE (MotC chaperone)
MIEADLAGAMVEEDDPAPPTKSRTGSGALKYFLPFPVIVVAVFAYLRWAPPDRAAERATDADDLPLFVRTLTEERAGLRRERDELRFVQRRLELERREIEDQRREVEALLARMQGSVQGLEEERDRTLAQVARVYDTMEPRAAARILTGVDAATSTEIVRRMRERPAAEVMAALDPTLARCISNRLVGP